MEGVFFLEKRKKEMVTRGDLSSKPLFPKKNSRLELNKSMISKQNSTFEI